MPRKPKKNLVKEPKIVEEIEEAIVEQPSSSEKDRLLNLYQELKDRGIRSISDLEGQIARAE